MFRQVDFQKQFSGGEPITYDGRLLWSAYWRPAREGEVIEITFERFTPRPVQGLMVGARGPAKLEVVNRRGAEFVLWTDTAPRTVPVRVAAAAGESLVGFWNVWRDPKHETMLYGLNAAAIEISEPATGEVVLRCSDGWKGPDFADLVVHLRIDPR